MEEQPATEVTSTANPTDVTAILRWWWIELWLENRRLFKEVVKHILLFGILASLLEIYHRIHQSSQLPVDESVLLNKIHFYGYIVLLVIMALCLVDSTMKCNFEING